MSKLLLSICILCSYVSIGQVNLPTGAAQTSFPLFKYEDVKSGLNTAIGLNYISGNGLKVNELASSVGTGWDLQVGGSITRIQNGEPDDQVGRAFSPDWVDGISFGTAPDLDYPNGYLYTTSNPQDALPGKVVHAPQFPMGFFRGYRQNFDDREQDIFVFQFNGRYGKFVIGKDKKPVVLNDSRLVVSFTESNMESEYIRTRIASYTITDESGMQYKFSEREVTDMLKYNNDVLINNLRVLKGVEHGPIWNRKIVTKWFLKEVINPLTNEKIVFNYSDVPIDIEGVKHVTRQTAVANGTTKVSQETLLERTKAVTKRISSIQFPDPYRVDFFYSTNERVDLKGDKALEGINILYNDRILYGYKFNYGYFFKQQIVPNSYSFQNQDIRYARLCLKDFRKVAADGATMPACEFTYNLPSGGPTDIIPAMYSLYADHWGYYNQSPLFIQEDANGFPTGGMTVKSFSNYSLQESKYGIIKSVKYPEGGSIQWDYEINKAENSPFQNKYAGGVRVSKTTIYDGINHMNDMVKSYKYVNADGTSSGWGFEVPVYTDTRALRQFKLSGTYNQGNNFKDLATNFIGKIIGNAPVAISPQGVAAGGGMFGSTAVSKASFDVIVVYLITHIIDLIVGDRFQDYDFSFIRSDNNNSINPLPFQYRRVEVVDEIWSNNVLTGTNGKVAYEYTSDQDYPLVDAGPFTVPYSSGKPRSAEWLYGLPKTATYYNAGGQPVKKTEKEYTPIVRQVINNYNISRSWYVNRVVAGAWNMFPYEFEPSFVNSVTYYPIQGRAQLNKSKEYVYDANGESTLFEESYAYSDSNFLPRTVAKRDSKGDEIGSTIYYVADFNNSSSIMKAMKNTNMMNVPISVNTWIKSGADATRQLTSSSVTEYAQLSDNDIRPFQLYQSELTAPISNSIVEPNDINFDKVNFKSYSYLKPKEAFFYLNGLSIQSVMNDGGRYTAKLYDHDSRFLVAEAVNAMNHEIKYTSFEGNSIGGWSYSAAGITTDYSPTGKKNFDLAKGALSATPTVSVNKPMVVSLWASNGSVVVNLEGTQYSPVKSGPTINGWIYLEFELPLFNTTLTITGNTRVDEVRLYPKNARVTTYTYDPGIGKTSECDLNNRITYFEYDTFGRLKGVKDENRNLIKAYEYNYKQ